MSNDTEIIDIIELHPQEIRMIKALRKLKFGEATVIIRNSLPSYLKEVIGTLPLDK